jgi:hypothetical protein
MISLPGYTLRWFLILCWSLFILCPSSADPLEDLKARLADQDTVLQPLPKAPIALSSEYVEVAVGTNGNFTMGTRQVDPTRTILGDSAYAAYWEPQTLAPGQTQTVKTLYGLGTLNIIEGDLIVGLFAPSQLALVNGEFVPNPFTVTAFISIPMLNTKTVIQDSVQAEILLPSGLSLPPGENSVHALGVLSPGANDQTSWHVLVTSNGGEELTYTVRVTRGETPMEVSRKIFLPGRQISLHPGFEQGVPIGDGLVQSSIGIGDIDQDGLGEIVIGGAEGSLFGYNDDGTPVLPGLSGPPGSLFTTPTHAPILSTPTLADVDYDHRDDIFFGTDAGVLYHLELRLSSDPVETISPVVGAVREPPLHKHSVRQKAQPLPEEGDDAGSR